MEPGNRTLLVTFLFSLSILCSTCVKENIVATGGTPPIARAGKDRVIVVPQDSVKLDGTLSEDPDGTIQHYSWSKIKGTSTVSFINSESARALVKITHRGTYEILLTVTDNDGLTGTDTVIIIANDSDSSNHMPIADAGQDLTLVSTHYALLDGSASADPDDNITSYEWTKISGPYETLIDDTSLVQTGVTLYGNGVYEFQLKVTDAGMLADTDTVSITVTSTSGEYQCSDRPVINARWVRVGSLSQKRIALVSAAAGTKILFAGGFVARAHSTRVDIYDTVTKTWSTAELTHPFRQGMVAASVGNKVLFAGGGEVEDITFHGTTRVDIYDASSNSWSTAELSKGRLYLAAATVGDKVLFAGGTAPETSAGGSTTWFTSKVVDIYNSSTNTWSVDSLGQKRSDLTATTVGSKVYFAGGFAGPFIQNVSARIDIYDAETNTWSLSQMQSSKAMHSSVAKGDFIFWGAGMINSVPGTSYYSNTVEMRNVRTGESSVFCMIPKLASSAVVKNNDVLFLPGHFSGGQVSGNHFDVYNTVSGEWKTAITDREIYDATVVSVNNTIYIAGGRNAPNGPYFDDVWKLEY